MLSVALCTYNGEKYIKAQLESLAGQTLLPDELVVSDDGSTDDTLRVVRDFSVQAPFSVRIYEQSSLGTVRNFSAAVARCDGDYIALCDQDDVWLPDKLADSMGIMKKKEKQCSQDCPILVHGDLCVVDEQLQVLQPSMMAAQGIADEPVMQEAFAVLLAQNYVTGCTVLLNRALKDIACPFPADIVMHDWWLALLASACGRIGFAVRPDILYRQHGGNQVGAKRLFSRASLLKLLDTGKIRHQMEAVLHQNRALLERIGDQGSTASLLTKEYLTVIRERRAWRCAAGLGVHKQKYVRDMFFRLFLFVYREDLAELLEERE